MTEINKTEESLFTLFSLYVLTRQHFNALMIHNNHFSKFVEQIDDKELQDDPWILEDTIYESLVHQIILKSCAFADEWNKSFGLTTSKEDEEKILLLKKAVKPASAYLNKLVESLRPYRNEAIAHNHRDKTGNIYLNKKNFDTPDSIYEIMLLVFCMEACVSPIKNIFSSKVHSILSSLNLLHSKAINPQPDKISQEEINNIIKKIEEQLEKNINENLLHILDGVSN